MIVKLTLNQDEAGYLSTMLKDRYGKPKKTALSTLLLMAAQEVAKMEARTQAEVNQLETIWSQPDEEL